MITLDKDKFLDDGYLVISNFYQIDQIILSKAEQMLDDYQYKIGRRYVTNNISSIPIELRQLILNKEIHNFFNSFSDENIKCQDIMITHEFKHDIMERNKWLHFDRWRSYKAMVYLTDVKKSNGPFSIVPKTHKKAKKLRREFCNLKYQDRPNRIKIDYPELYQEPLPIVGKAGTLILFDSDIFHLGGKIDFQKQRMLIRSHWYSNNTWREKS